MQKKPQQTLVDAITYMNAKNDINEWTLWGLSGPPQVQVWE